MRELDKALADIGAIRDQIARQDGFRSYGPATVAADRRSPRRRWQRVNGSLRDRSKVPSPISPPG